MLFLPYNLPVLIFLTALFFLFVFADFLINLLKYNRLIKLLIKIAIEQLSYKHPIHIICVQETWIDSNSKTCMFELPNYQLISRGK